MKLYDVPRETYIRLLENASVPPGSPDIKSNTILFFDHVDGMYSFCIDCEKKQIIHLSAFTEVEIVEEELDNL